MLYFVGGGGVKCSELLDTKAYYTLPQSIVCYALPQSIVCYALLQSVVYFWTPKCTTLYPKA